MFGFNDLDDLIRGYSKEDDYIARDLVLIDILIKKGIITNEEIVEAYKKELPNKIEQVKKARREDIEKKLKEIESRK